MSMMKKKKQKKTSVSLLNVSELAIKSVEVSKKVPRSAEVERLIQERRAEDPFEVGSQMTASDIQYKHDKAYLKLRAYLRIFAFLFLDQAIINRVNSDTPLKEDLKKLWEEFFQKYPPKNSDEVKVEIYTSVTDFALQLQGLSEYAQLLGMLKYDPFKILLFKIRLVKLIVQLKNEKHLKLKGFMYLLSEINKDKSPGELRALFRRNGVPEPSIKKFFREDENRKERQGKPEEYWIYRDKNNEFHYQRANFNTTDVVVQRGIFDVDEAYAAVKELNNKFQT